MARAFLQQNFAWFGAAYFFAVILFSCLSVVALQLLFLPSLKACLFSDFSKIGASIALNKELFSLAFSCASKPLLALFAFPALFFVSLLNRPFFRRFSAALAAVSSSPKKAIIFLGVVLAVATSFYLAPGDILVSDAGPFQATVASYYNSFSHGALPFFTFDWYGGSMHFYYYGIVYFVLAGLANLVFHDVNLTTKILLWLFNIGSGLVFYMLAMRLARSRTAALAAAVLYALAFEHVAQVMITGRFLDAVIYVALPLMVMVLEGQIVGKLGLRKGTILLSLLLSVVFLNSPADSVYVFSLFGLYALVRLLQSRSRPLLVSLIASGIIFLLLTAFWVVPFFLEKAYVNGTARVLNEVKPVVDLAAVSRLFVWPGFWGQSRAYYVPLTAIALALGAAYLLAKRKLDQLSSGRLLASGFAAAAGLALLVLVSGRAGSGFLTFSCIMALYGAEAFLSGRLFWKSFSQKTLAAILLVVVLVDVLPATIQPSYADFSYEKSFLDANLPKAGYSARVLDLHTNYRTYYPYVPYVNNGLPVVFGPLPEGAPRSFPYAAAISDLAAHEIYDENVALSDVSRAGLFLLNVGYVIIHYEQVGVDPNVAFKSKRYSFGMERDLKVVELQYSPIIVSKRVARIPSGNPIEKDESFFTKQKFNARELNWSYTSEIIGRMNISMAKNSADVILVKNADDAVINSADDASVKLVDFSASPVRVVMKVNSTSEAFARLSYSYYPWLTVKVNGEKEELMQTAMNFVAVKVGKGVSEIVIEGTLSQAHKAFGFLSSVSLLGCLVLLFTRHKQG